MHDQAKRLREKIIDRGNRVKMTRVVTVTSGKGGVGKSNFTLNFALALLKKGQKVVIFDADIGLANIDVLMGVSPKFNLFQMIESNMSIWDIIEKGPCGLEFIAGGSGFTQLLHMDERKLTYFFEQLSKLNGYADTILLDTGAGLSKESLRFILAADEVLLVTTPEPTAITDAYAIIKMVHSKNPFIKFKLIVNRVSSEREGKITADKIILVAKQFLGMEIKTLGFISDDFNVQKSVKKQQPFYLAYPKSSASKEVELMVDAYLAGNQTAPYLSTGMKGFLVKMIKMMNQK